MRRTLTRTALFVYLCLGLSYAQSKALPDAPQPQPALHAAMPAAVQSHPSPSRPSLLDRKFVLWSAISFGATIADVESTRHAIDNCGLREANPLYGPNPSRAKMYATTLPIAAAQSVLGWYLRERNPDSKLWMLLPAANTAVHSAGFVNNIARCR